MRLRGSILFKCLMLPVVLSETRSTWRCIINAVTMQTEGKKHLHWRPCLMNVRRKGIVTVMQTTLSHSNPPNSNQSDPMQWWIYGVGRAPTEHYFYHFYVICGKKILQTRLHSSRMRTARMLTVSPSMLCTGGCTWSQGVSALGGSAPGGSAPGGMRVPGPGGSVPGGVCSGGVCLLLGGVCSWGCTWSQRGVCSQGGCLLPVGDVCSQGVYLPRHSPPVNRILDTRLWKYYLAPKFVCGRWQ